jgi:hypothetical protein
MAAGNDIDTTGSMVVGNIIQGALVGSAVGTLCLQLILIHYK